MTKRRDPAARGLAEAEWVAALQQVHARFKGRPGTFAQFGDSITVTKAFWSPLRYARKHAPPEMERAYARVEAHMKPETWGEWKGPAFGSEGGKTAAWAEENIDRWLRDLNPELALILFGTNDLHSSEVREYQERIRAVVRKCLDNGTVVLLSTIPPRHGFEKKAEAFAIAVRQVARELAVPLTDFHEAIVQRRPNDWDGALPLFRKYEGYDVPTLLSRDGVHPSLPVAYQDDYSAEALRSAGYNLRNYLTLQAVSEILRLVLKPEPGTIAATPVRPWFPMAPPLPPPIGPVVRVGTVPALVSALERIEPGGTILLEDGVYHTGALEIRTDRVTLRSASDQRERVVLDGDNQGELLRLSRCTGVTIANLTLQNIRWNGIKINSETGVQDLRIYNCVLHNIWQRAIKGVKVPAQDRERLRPRRARIEYCLFYNDRPKQLRDDPSDTEQTYRGDYIGGIDVMYAQGWVICDNVFVGIRGRNGEARGAIFLWHDARDCVVERNVVIDCDSGICLGNGQPPPDSPVHATGCIVRNNFLTRVPENGILADDTRDCTIVHNSVFDPTSAKGRLIRLVHGNAGLVVANNLLCGAAIRVESPGPMTLRGNLVRDLSSALVAPEEGNLRLTARAVEAIDRAVGESSPGDDIDRSRRDRKPDIGAHEWTGR